LPIWSVRDAVDPDVVRGGENWTSPNPAKRAWGTRANYLLSPEPRARPGSAPRRGWRIFERQSPADDVETARTFFLNASRVAARADYVCYTTGEIARREELVRELQDWLAMVLGGSEA
jgi:hypothetical protein